MTGLFLYHSDNEDLKILYLFIPSVVGKDL